MSLTLCSMLPVDLSAANLGEFSQQWKYSLKTEKKQPDLNSPALDSDLETQKSISCSWSQSEMRSFILKMDTQVNR